MAVHVLDAMAREGFEQVIALHDRDSGLRAFVGVHDTSAGPAFGGIRRFPYRDERSALIDCLRLSRAMSRKCALAGIRGGGGKIVVLDHAELQREPAYAHLGRAIERLGGRYYAGPDVGTGPDELRWVATETAYVTRPGEGGPGHLEAATAAGVFAGMAAALRADEGEEAWERRTVVVQGLGNVGQVLVERLLARGARVVGSEIDPVREEAAREKWDIELVRPGTEVDVECDVFCPCAMGGILHDLTIQRLRTRIVCGSANNPLAHRRHGQRLHELGILYVPDFVVSAGALIRGAEFHQTGRATALDEIERRVSSVVGDVLALAAAEQRAPSIVAIEEADRRIRERRRAARTPDAASPPTPSPAPGGPPVTS